MALLNLAQKTLPTSISGAALRTALVSDAGQIETEVNRISPIVDSDHSSLSILSADYNGAIKPEVNRLTPIVNQLNLSSGAILSNISSVAQNAAAATAAISQVEYARNQALAGLGAADNSQILSNLLEQHAYAADIAGVAAKEMLINRVRLDSAEPAIDLITTHIIALADMVGVAARAISGGDVLLRAGTASNPSLQSVDNKNTGIYFPAANQLGVTTNGVQRILIDATGNVATGTDNTQTLGTSAKRWSTIYAGTGTINTSDARQKTSVSALTADEINAAKQLSKEIGTYKFLASIALKGDAARTHIGLTVQRAIEIMQLNNLNPFAYGFICFDEWTEQTIEHPALDAVLPTLDADGNEIDAGREAVAAWSEIVQTAGDAYAFRYDQLALFICAGIEARLSALEI